MPTLNPNAEVIKAWAGGATVETRKRGTTDDWTECGTPGAESQPGWFEEYDYRIKKDPLPNVVMWHGVSYGNPLYISAGVENRTYQASGQRFAKLLRVEINPNDMTLVSARLEDV